MKKTVLYSILVLFAVSSNAQIASDTGLQKKVDSLKLLMTNSKTDKKLSYYKEIIRLFVNSDPDICLKYTDSLFLFSTKENNKNGIALSYFYKAISYKNKSEYNKAFTCNFKALHLFEELNDSTLQGNTLLHIAVCYTNLKSYSKSLEYLEKAERIYENIGDYSGIIWVLGNKSIIYGKQNLYEKALEIQQLMLTILKSDTLKGTDFIYDNIIKTEINIAVSYMHINNFEKAEKYSLDALVPIRKLKDKVSEALVLLNLGQIKSQLGDTKQALNYLNEATVISKQIKDKLLLINCYKSTADCYEKDRNYKKSNEFLIKYNDLYQKVYSADEFEV